LIQLQESQIDTSTTERQLLYDIRAESRKTNELLTQLLEVLRPLAKDTVQAEESKEDIIDGTLPISEGSSSDLDPSRNSTRPADKRKAIPNKQHRGATGVSKPKSNSNGSKRISSTSRTSAASKADGKK